MSVAGTYWQEFDSSVFQMQGFHTLMVCVSVDFHFGEAGWMVDGWSDNSDESQRNGKTNSRFFSGFGANATLTGNHGAASTKLQLRLELKGVCQVEDSIFLHVFSCLRQTQHKSPKSGRPAVILQVKMTESLYLKIK